METVPEKIVSIKFWSKYKSTKVRKKRNFTHLGYALLIQNS